MVNFTVGRILVQAEIGSLPYLSHDFEHYCSSGFFVRYYNLTGKEAAEKACDGRCEDYGNLDVCLGLT